MPARQSLEQASSYALAFFDLVHCRPERSRRAAAVQACEGKKSTAQHRAAMSIVPSSAVTLAGAEQAVRAGIAAAEKSGGALGSWSFCSCCPRLHASSLCQTRSCQTSQRLESRCRNLRCWWKPDCAASHGWLHADWCRDRNGKSSIRDPLCPGSFASKVYPH